MVSGTDNKGHGTYSPQEGRMDKMLDGQPPNRALVSPTLLRGLRFHHAARP